MSACNQPQGLDLVSRRGDQGDSRRAGSGAADTAAGGCRAVEGEVYGAVQRTGAPGSRGHINVHITPNSAPPPSAWRDPLALRA